VKPHKLDAETKKDRKKTKKKSKPGNLKKVPGAEVMVGGNDRKTGQKKKKNWGNCRHVRTPGSNRKQLTNTSQEGGVKESRITAIEPRNRCKKAGDGAWAGYGGGNNGSGRKKNRRNKNGKKKGLLERM